MIIGGRTWVVVKNPKERGGWFSSDKGKIGLGTNNFTQQEIEQEYLHEIVEATLAERLLRYKLPYTREENGHYLFVFDHAQMEEWVKDLYLALS